MIPTTTKLTAVREADQGQPITSIANRLNVSRQSIYRWMRSYRTEGLAGLQDKSHKPLRPPRRMIPEIEAMVCCISQSRPEWGAERVTNELIQLGVINVPSTSSVRRVIHRNRLNP